MMRSFVVVFSSRSLNLIIIYSDMFFFFFSSVLTLFFLGHSPLGFGELYLVCMDRADAQICASPCKLPLKLLLVYN